MPINRDSVSPALAVLIGAAGGEAEAGIALIGTRQHSGDLARR